MIDDEKKFAFSKEHEKVLAKLWNRFFEAHTVNGVCEVDVGYFWDCMAKTVKILRPDLYALSLKNRV